MIFLNFSFSFFVVFQMIYLVSFFFLFTLSKSEPASAQVAYSEYAINLIISNSNFSLVLVCDFNDPETDSIKDMFSRVSTFFEKNGSFVMIDSEKYSKVLNKYEQVPPCLVLYKNKAEWLVLPAPTDENQLLFLCDHFFSQKVLTTQNIADVLSFLGHSNFAILATAEQVPEMINLRFKVAPYIGNCEIIVCDKKLLKDYFQIEDGNIGIFRIEDKAVQSIKPTFDNVFEATIPVFRQFVTTDFRESNATFVAFVGYQRNSYIDDLLFNISVTFEKTDFIFGFLEPRLHYIARHATLQKFEQLPTIIAFSTHDRSFFPVDSKYFKEPFSMLTKDQWIKDATNYLEMIAKGKIKRQYHSEVLDKKNKSDPVEKIVGTTYNSFMNDKKHDLYVLYIDQNRSECLHALDEFRKAATIATSIRFGVIDIILNSSPLAFPHIHSLPYVRFYPSKNRSNDVPFLHTMKSNDFLRFAMKFGSKDYKFDVPVKSKMEFRREIHNFSLIINHLPPEDQAKMEPYFKALWYEVGMRPGLTIPDDEDEL